MILAVVDQITIPVLLAAVLVHKVEMMIIWIKWWWWTTTKRACRLSLYRPKQIINLPSCTLSIISSSSSNRHLHSPKWINKCTILNRNSNSNSNSKCVTVIPKHNLSRNHSKLVTTCIICLLNNSSSNNLCICLAVVELISSLPIIITLNILILNKAILYLICHLLLPMLFYLLNIKRSNTIHKHKRKRNNIIILSNTNHHKHSASSSILLALSHQHSIADRLLYNMAPTWAQYLRPTWALLPVLPCQHIALSVQAKNHLSCEFRFQILVQTIRPIQQSIGISWAYRQCHRQPPAWKMTWQRMKLTMPSSLPLLHPSPIIDSQSQVLRPLYHRNLLKTCLRHPHSIQSSINKMSFPAHWTFHLHPSLQTIIIQMEVGEEEAMHSTGLNQPLSNETIDLRHWSRNYRTCLCVIACTEANALFFQL